MRCKRCDTTMQDGKAIMPDTPVMRTPDFAGNTEQSRGQTVTKVSSGQVHTVKKCPKCGHSVTL